VPARISDVAWSASKLADDILVVAGTELIRIPK
jgi:hypothetical protein